MVPTNFLEVSHMLFSYSKYSSYLSQAKEMAQICPIKDWNKSNINILLRHDVDFDLSMAYKLSEVELAADVRSSYFIRTTAGTYNPNSLANRKILQKMDQNGFEIGLHFDPSIYMTEDVELLNRQADFEASILSEIIGKQIQSVSLHNPSCHGKFPLFPNYINAYDPQLFSSENYMSDSCMSFRDKDPFNFLSRAKKETVQLLFHPIHFSHEECGYIEKFRSHLTDCIDNIEETFKVNYAVKDELGGDSLAKKLVNLD